MAKKQTITGTITRVSVSDTRYGLRAEGTLSRKDFTTGETIEQPFKAWGDVAEKISDLGQNAQAGMRGGWKPATQNTPAIFATYDVAECRIIDPATVDLSTCA